MAAALSTFLQSAKAYSIWRPSHFNKHVTDCIDVYLIGVVAFKAISGRYSSAPRHGKEALKLQRSRISKFYQVCEEFLHLRRVKHYYAAAEFNFEARHLLPYS